MSYLALHLKYVRRVSGITCIRYAQSRKIGKPNNFKIFGSNETKGLKQDSQDPHSHSFCPSFYSSSSGFALILINFLETK